MKNNKIFILIISLLSISYFLMFNLTKLSAVTSVIALLLIYYKLLFTKEHYIELLLTLFMFNHVLIPTIGQIDRSKWELVSFCVKYLPFMIALFKNFVKSGKVQIKSCIFMIIYAFFTLLRSLYDISISMDLITGRLIPLVVIILFIAIIYDKSSINMDNILLVGRVALIISAVVYILPGYIKGLTEIFENGFLYNVPVYNIEYYQGGNFMRNQGVFFDARILGIVAYLMYFIIVIRKTRYRNFDLALVLFSSLTTFSRGNIVVLAFITMGLFVSNKLKESAKRNIIIIFVLSLFLLPVVVAKFSNTNSYRNFLQTLNIFSDKRNVINQRQQLSDMALQEAKKNIVFGNGVGWVSSKNNIVLGNYYYTVASDAYFSILLAEIGLFGIFIFMLQNFQLFNCKNLYNFIFFLGFNIHLIGTDIPDSSTDYVYIGILTFIFTKYVAEISKSNLSNEDTNAI